MGFWQRSKHNNLGRLQLNQDKPTHFQSTSFLLGSSTSNELFLGYDGSLGNNNYKKMSHNQEINTKNDINWNNKDLENDENKVNENITQVEVEVKVKDFTNKQHKELKQEEIITSTSTRILKFNQVLQSEPIDLALLKQLSWRGIPNELRSLIWKLLLGYLPLPIHRRASTLAHKRETYQAYKKQYLNNLPESNDELYHQILIDVPRTFPLNKIIQHFKVQKMLERVLYVWSLRHPASGYVQGINDLATPFIIVFLEAYTENINDFDLSNFNQLTEEQLEEVEADTFWCLSKLLDGIQDSFTSAQRGIQRQLNLLRYLIQRIDSKLANHLEKENVHYVQFAFRWMNCLLMREFPLQHVVRLWDTYLAESPHGFSDFHVYVCAAYLIHWSKLLLEMEFQELIMFLQNPPTSDWPIDKVEMLLSQAFMWWTIFKDAPNHLEKDS